MRLVWTVLFLFLLFCEGGQLEAVLCRLHLSFICYVSSVFRHTLTLTCENFQISVCEIIFVCPLEVRWEVADLAGSTLYESLLFILSYQIYLSNKLAVPIFLQ